MHDDTHGIEPGIDYMVNRKNVNLDITHRCPLECPRCQRATSFTSKGLKVPGEDMPFDEFKKVTSHFNHVNFCGQVSDPVHHPKFKEFLEYLYEQKKSTSVHHASGGKPLKWYPEAFKANPDAKWWLGIDGLPEDSPKYRINQDGHKMMEILKLAREYLNQKPIWQMIVFNFNEHQIEECMNMADKLDVDFGLISSSRWLNDNDPLRPSSAYALSL